MTLDEFFEGYEESKALFDAVRPVIDALGSVGVRISKSQIAFRGRKAFAWVWIPEKHLHRKAAPLVLSISLDRRDDSPRWKQIVEPSPGRLMHHLEVCSTNDIDDEVRDWLSEAWTLAA